MVSRNETLAYKIVNTALRNMKLRMESLTYAINILRPTAVDIELRQLNTDGERLFFHADYVLGLYEQGRTEELEKQVLHILLHGYLGHFQDTNYVRKKLAWRVMDLSVEQIMVKIGAKGQCFSAKPKELATVGMGLYHQAKNNKNLAQKVLQRGREGEVDQHQFWWEKPSAKKGQAGNAEETSNLREGDDGSSSIADKWEKAREYLLGGEGNSSQQIEQRIVNAMNHKNEGHGTETMDQSAYVSCTEKELSFHEVFREFLTNRPVPRECADLYDRMLYQYGLDMYGDIPLVEPMEEREEVRLGNLVIAIDTSGSCEEYLSLFFTQLVGIFRDIGTKYSFDKIYLIQCDWKIKSVCVFEDIEQLAEVKHSLRMIGFGGTSFTPVFRWIDRNLLEAGENLDCLLYFSDGEGDFPGVRPDYPVFFVLPPRQVPFPVEIPNWIRRVYMGEQIVMK